jgi:hypothetical protein
MVKNIKQDQEKLSISLIPSQHSVRLAIFPQLSKDRF